MPDNLKYGSDVVVDLLIQMGIPYVAFNPGSSFRGIHDSLIHYSADAPEIIQCCHEEIAVAMAHGYAKASGKMMAVAIHDTVGLQHASMAIYNAWCDRAPILLLGGTDPLDATKRRPWIHWVHSTLVAGNLVRDYVKWDDQPFSVAAFPESLIRAYRLALTPPQGPVYVALGTEMQEQELPAGFSLPDLRDFPMPILDGAGPRVIADLAQNLLEAKRPVLVTDLVEREERVFEVLGKLVQLLRLPVFDLENDAGGMGLVPQSEYYLGRSSRAILGEADFILALDTEDLFGELSSFNDKTKVSQPLYSPEVNITHVGVKELQKSSWSAAYERLQPRCQSILAPVGKVLPGLLEQAEKLLAQTPGGLSSGRLEWAEKWSRQGQEERQKWLGRALAASEEEPISIAWLAREVWEAVKGENWVLGPRSGLQGWVHRLWEFEKPQQYVGSARAGAGVGVQIGTAVGAALAHRGSGAMVVDLQSDGDFLYCTSALWTVAHYELPLLMVMNNNRTYYNTEFQQGKIAALRGHDASKTWIGNHIRRPEVDFAGLARDFGIWSTGPVTDPRQLRRALLEAVKVVKGGKPALVDVVTKGFERHSI